MDVKQDYIENVLFLYTFKFFFILSRPFLHAFSVFVKLAIANRIKNKNTPFRAPSANRPISYRYTGGIW